MTVVMPVGFQVVLDLDLEGYVFLSKTWRKRSSGQIATSIWFFHSKKCLTGGFSSVEIFFWFPLLIALNGHFCFNDQYRRRDANF